MHQNKAATSESDSPNRYVFREDLNVSIENDCFTELGNALKNLGLATLKLRPPFKPFYVR